MPRTAKTPPTREQSSRDKPPLRRSKKAETVGALVKVPVPIGWAGLKDDVVVARNDGRPAPSQVLAVARVGNWVEMFAQPMAPADEAMWLAGSLALAASIPGTRTEKLAAWQALRRPTGLATLARAAEPALVAGLDAHQPSGKEGQALARAGTTALLLHLASAIQAFRGGWNGNGHIYGYRLPWLVGLAGAGHRQELLLDSLARLAAALPRKRSLAKHLGSMVAAIKRPRSLRDLPSVGTSSYRIALEQLCSPVGAAPKLSRNAESLGVLAYMLRIGRLVEAPEFADALEVTGAAVGPTERFGHAEEWVRTEAGYTAAQAFCAAALMASARGLVPHSDDWSSALSGAPPCCEDAVPELTPRLSFDELERLERSGLGRSSPLRRAVADRDLPAALAAARGARWEALPVTWQHALLETSTPAASAATVLKLARRERVPPRRVQDWLRKHAAQEVTAAERLRWELHNIAKQPAGRTLDFAADDPSFPSILLSALQPEGRLDAALLRTVDQILSPAFLLPLLAGHDPATFAALAALAAGGPSDAPSVCALLDGTGAGLVPRAATEAVLESSKDRNLEQTVAERLLEFGRKHLLGPELRILRQRFPDPLEDSRIAAAMVGTAAEADAVVDALLRSAVVETNRFALAIAQLVERGRHDAVKRLADGAGPSIAALYATYRGRFGAVPDALEQAYLSAPRPAKGSHAWRAYRWEEAAAAFHGSRGR